MRKLPNIILTLVFIHAFTYQANSQAASVYAVGGFHSVNSKSFNAFASNFNQLYGSVLVKKIDSKILGLNLGAGANYALENGWLFGGEYTTGYADAEATFTDSTKVSFKTRFDQGTLYAGYTPGPFDDIFYLYPFAGFSAGRNQIIATNTANGNYDIYNGTYSGFTFKFVTGLHVAFGKDNIKTLVRVLYSFPLGSSQLETDQNDRIASDPLSYSQNPPAYRGEYLRSDWRGLTVDVGFAVNFGW
jgi:hypothetical protein